MGLIFDLDQTIVDSRVAEVYRKKRDWTSVYKQIPNFKLYSDITDVLRYGRQNGLKICIVTSSPQTYCSRVLSAWNVPHDFMVCYHDTTNKKPHPEPIIKALDLLQVSPQLALSFGDRAIDVAASKGANVKSVSCYWGTEEIFELENATATYSAKNPKDLFVIIQKYFGLKSDKYIEEDIF